MRRLLPPVIDPLHIPIEKGLQLVIAFFGVVVVPFLCRMDPEPLELSDNSTSGMSRRVVLTIWAQSFPRSLAGFPPNGCPTSNWRQCRPAR